MLTRLVVLILLVHFSSAWCLWDCPTKPPPAPCTCDTGAVPEDEIQCGLSCSCGDLCYRKLTARKDDTCDITGGKKAQQAQYPWMVSISIRNEYGEDGHACGGTLINRKWVMTAAHCFKARDMRKNEWSWGRGFRAVTVYTGVGKRIHNHAEFVQATSGVNKYKVKFGATEHKVRNIQIHTDWTETANDGDIALVKLKRAVKYPKNVVNDGLTLVRPACLPSPTEKSVRSSNGGRRFKTAREQNMCHVTGYGNNEHEGDVKKESAFWKLSVKIREAKDTGNSGKYQCLAGNTDKFCAGEEVEYIGNGLDAENRIIKDACQGDSGGPLSCLQDTCATCEESLIVTGLVSRGMKCEIGVYHPQLQKEWNQYTDIKKHVEWIERKTRLNKKSAVQYRH